MLTLLKLVCLFSFIKLSVSSDFYSYTILDHEGKEFSLDKYRGKVTLVVNVASQCGFTDTSYRALTRLHDILSYDGYFSVLAFPCNQFGEQEPADASDIVPTMQHQYGVEFPIFNKVDIIGSSAIPAFKNLIEQSSIVPDWNFYKYLVDDDGKVIKGWGTRITIEEIFDDIEAAIKIAKAKALANSTQKESTKQSEEESQKDEL